MAALLSIKDLTIEFQTETGTSPGVQNINLDVHRGEIVALVGESGSGKSITSLSVLQLLPMPPARVVSGQILFTTRDGASIDLLQQSPAAMQDIRGNEIAMIFQEPMTSLNPVLTCGYQVTEAIRVHRRLTAEEARKEAIALFEKVRLPDPTGIFSRYPHQLSGGQKQRVMIAMAMSNRPSLLICDEPTTALDVTVQKTILELIRSLQETENMGVIFITHDLGVVAGIADRALVLYKGNVVEESSVMQLFHHPQHPYTRGLLERWRAIQTPPPKSAPAGRDELSSLPAGNTLMEIKDLKVWYPSRKSFLGKPQSYTRAVDDISFRIFRGETLGLVGESGCGKTTLGRTLLRLIEPTAGRILFEGRDLSTYTAHELKKLRSHIQIVFQDPYSSLNPRIPIGPAIAEVLKVHGRGTTDGQRKEQVVELLEKVSLSAEHYNRYPHEFSGGQRQRIVIARALILRPSFVVCDESVSALDVSIQAQVLNLLNQLKKELGFTVVFISHDLQVIRYISDRILVMNKGRIEEIGEAEEVYNTPRSEYTKKLLEAVPKAM
ncbi:MAG TPA: ABC transporter ATP-binding protein [Puia sp.]|nr:ABC transporter ATP-binding protein [Puia sp.]